ncbi:MAG TPA: cell wall hydrolase [Alteraurantiacibacter sp.]
MPQLPIPQRESTLERIRARRERRTRRRTLLGRIAALAAIVGVPALAAPDAWGEYANARTEPETPAAMPFETPGESFPGSAFYYLADEPYLPLSIEAEIRAETDLPPLAPLPSAAQEARELIAASPFRLGGTAEDQARALKCLAMAVYYEAASESDAGQRAVAQVVLNRVSHPTYPNSVCGVVFQGSERRTGCQFTFTCDGSLGRKPSRLFWDRAERVARNALYGAVYRPVGLATHYHTLAVNPYWASSLRTVGVIGFHRFYRWRGAAGRPAAFHASYTMREPAPRTASGTTSQAASGDPGAPATASAAANAAPAVYEAAVQPELPKIPQSGTIRAEYADSGSWIARP